jgi:uncharacterized protein YcbX
MSRSENGNVVARVVGLWRYPVKSMSGQELLEAEVSWNGLAGDRRWAFVRDRAVQSGFPWLTQRERADMGRYRATLVDPARADKTPTVIQNPSGVIRDVADPELAAELGPGVRVIKQDRGVFDTLPLSLVTTQTIAALGAQVGAELDVRRFRPNVLVEAIADEPFAEDTWVGRVMRLGRMRMRVDKRDERCLVVTIDPDTTERNPAILRAIARDRQGCLGVYGSTVEPGRIAVGDSVIIDTPV